MPCSRVDTVLFVIFGMTNRMCSPDHYVDLQDDSIATRLHLSRGFEIRTIRSKQSLTLEVSIVPVLQIRATAYGEHGFDHAFGHLPLSVFFARHRVVVWTTKIADALDLVVPVDKLPHEAWLE